MDGTVLLTAKSALLELTACDTILSFFLVSFS